MKALNILVLASGNGTNFQSLIDSQENILPINVVGLITDKEDCYSLERAKNNNIPYKVLVNNFNSREEYDNELLKLIREFNFDLIVLAGWMRIITNTIIQNVNEIINIHPALPGKYPGTNAIQRAYNNNDKETGVMVHRVVEEVDAGEVLDLIKVPILSTDSLEVLEDRVKTAEKSVLIKALMNLISSKNNEKSERLSGKVRDRFSLGYDLICFHLTNRLSSFDRHICDVEGKGMLLNKINKWWMDRTQHIIKNHLLYTEDEYLIAKKCRVIPLEIIVRGYMTGSTNTSLWTHYKNGEREYCGLIFRDGYTKNQILDCPVITPTTKGEVDELISREQILERGIVTLKELNFIYNKAMELYSFGVKKMSERGLILVDTKYEFGYDSNGDIILIDEIHTCDSSRFWTLDSYLSGGEPRKLDKDSARNYVKSLCDPYTVEELPPIPDEKKLEVFNCYKELYDSLTGKISSNDEFLISNDDDNRENRIIHNYFMNYHKQIVVILSGSESDKFWVDKLKTNLDNNDIYAVDYVCSAHKKTKELLSILDKYNSNERQTIFVTVAGRSNALSGVVACNTSYPVIACPPFKDKLDMATNINSTLQMPSYVPVMTILEPINVALSCVRLFNLCNN